jgi:hypothetical protein
MAAFRLIFVSFSCLWYIPNLNGFKKLTTRQPDRKKDLHYFSGKQFFLKIPETPKVFLLKKFKKDLLILLNNF